MFLADEFTEKTLLITGGSRGIGRALVGFFAERAAQVIFLYRENHQAAQELCDRFANVLAYQCDIADDTACQATFKEMGLSRVDVLINNSGISHEALLATTPASEVNRILQTNVAGMISICQAVIPLMLRQKAGKIINISSVCATKGGQGQAVYAASKGAVNAMTQALAVELARKNIQVNAVAPGVITTDMTAQIRDLAADKVLDKILQKRFGEPEDVVHAVAFLASPYASYLTGVILPVDGGFKMA